MPARAPASKVTSGTGVPSNAVGASGDWYLDSAAGSWYQKAGGAWAVKVNGGSLPSIAYRLVSDGATVTAYDKTGASVASGADAGAVLAAVLPAANSAGATIEFRNDGHVFPWATVPALPKGVTGKLLIRGNGSTVQLSSGGPRFLDFSQVVTAAAGAGGFTDDATITVTDTSAFASSGSFVLGLSIVTYTGKTPTTFTGCTAGAHTAYAAGDPVIQAGYETFQNIEIRGFVIDCNNVGLRHHVVIGSYRNGTAYPLFSVKNLLVEDVRTINVPVDATLTNHRMNIYIEVAMPTGATATSLNGIKVKNVRFEGGNAGVHIGATGAAGSTCALDQVEVDGWYHSMLTVQTTTFTSEHVQIGAKATTNYCRVANGYGEFSGDIGVEIDNAAFAVVENVTCVDDFNGGFYLTNFTAPANPSEQLIQFKSCRARKLTCTGASHGFSVAQNAGVAIGSVLYDDCEWYCNEPTTTTGRGFTTSVGATKFSFHKCRFIMEGFTSSTATQLIRPFTFNQGAGVVVTKIVIDDVKVSVVGTNSGSQTGWRISPVFLNGGTVILQARELDITASITGVVNGTTIPIDVAVNNATTLAGYLDGLRLTTTVDATPDGILIGSNTTVTAPFRIDNCDFSGMSGGTEIVVVTAATKANIRTRNNVWHTQPVPVAFTALTTATGKVLGTMWDAMVVFAQGSGSAITALDFSTDAGGHYTNYLTQASAALPGGFAQSLGPLSSDSLIKATFTTTQPTISLVPVNP